MTSRIDLNADMGEGFGDWTIGDDDALLGIITSANIACGLHAGDWDVMASVMQRAAERGVGLGAHPGFPDLQGFGRRRMQISHDSLGNLVRYQIGAAQAMAKAAGTALRHIKLHGALGNMTSEDKSMALACYRAALSVSPDLTIVVLAKTAQEAAVRELKCKVASEIFADRAYNADATLVDRRESGAVIHDPEQAATRVAKMIGEGAIIAESGRRIPTRIDTVCVHGDTPEAVQIAARVREKVSAAGIEVVAFEGIPLSR